MLNKEIEKHVDTLLQNYLQHTKLRPEDKPALVALAALITNLLININDIADR